MFKKITAIASVLSLVLVALPVSAATDVIVTNNNSVTVDNAVSITSNTGDNNANGGHSVSEIGNGSVQNSGDENSAGNNDNQTLGGTGGVITTGNANTVVNITNHANRNVTRINVVDENPRDDVNVRNNNDAHINNDVTARLSTGDNMAIGGAATQTVYGGAVNGAGSENTSGNNDNTSWAGDGGMVTTGNAGSNAYIVNRVNYNRTAVEGMDNDDSNNNDVTVRNENSITIRNVDEATHKTGNNRANGGVADGMVSGGNVMDAGSENTAGNSGNQTLGGLGGRITTGNSSSISEKTNIFNVNITRVRR